MKRWGKALVVILALIIGCGCVCSCSGRGGEKADICDAVTMTCDAVGGENQMAVFYSDCTRECENVAFSELSTEEAGFLYTGKFDTPACFSGVVGYAIRMPLDDSGFEVHIIECVNPSDAEQVSRLLLARVEKMQSAEILEYAPEGYEICFRGATVCVFGRFACLFSTPDNALAEKTARSILS